MKLVRKLLDSAVRPLIPRITVRVPKWALIAALVILGGIAVGIVL